MKLEKKKELLIRDLISLGALKTPKIIEAFRNVPRHLFIPLHEIRYAYEDIALPTYKGQTISQPYTVAIMTEALAPKEGEKILEVGAGSGWQAAILGYCVGPTGKVITIEIDEDLARFARRNIKKVGLKNVEVIIGDGSLGYEEEAPYDGCMITAACPEIPKPIVEQVKVGGRIVAPVGSLFEQAMILAYKGKGNKLEKRYLGPFIFVPLRGKYGFRL